MDPTKLTMQQAMMYAALINAGIGLVLGLIPLIVGFVKGNRKYGLLGFAGAIVSGALIGVILSVPVSAVFTWLIVRKPKASQSPDTADSSENS